MFFFSLSTSTFLALKKIPFFPTKKNYLVINNEYKRVIFTLLLGVYQTRMIETFSNANACMVHMVHNDIYAKNENGVARY